MTTLHATNTYNIETTLNKWFKDQLDAITKPSVLASFTHVFNLPETPLVAPCFSYAHLPISTRKLWQGDQTGGLVRGARTASLLDLSCWVSRKAVAWNAQLTFMRGMVEQVFASERTLQVSDYTTNVASPSAVQYKIDLRSCESPAVQPDLNPDIMRSRFLIRYEWTVRS